jgi:hypothetical protein
LSFVLTPRALRALPPPPLPLPQIFPESKKVTHSHKILSDPLIEAGHFLKRRGACADSRSPPQVVLSGGALKRWGTQNAGQLLTKTKRSAHFAGRLNQVEQQAFFLVPVVFSHLLCRNWI